jgi:hypothetical protein
MTLTTVAAVALLPAHLSHRVELTAVAAAQEIAKAAVIDSVVFKRAQRISGAASPGSAEIGGGGSGSWIATVTVVGDEVC